MKKILFLLIISFSFNMFSHENLDDNSNQQSRNGTYVMDIPEICYYEIKITGSTWTIKFLDLNTGVSEYGEHSYRSNNGIIKGNTLYDKSGDKKIGYFEDGYIVFHLLDDGTIVRKSYVYTKVNSKK